MTLLVDSRIGSHDLVKPLTARGLPVEETHLEFGDICFQGTGPNDTILDIGIELKRLSDLVGSLRSGRLAGHQLPGLLGQQGAYDYAWIVVEGHYRVNDVGQMTTHLSKKQRCPTVIGVCQNPTHWTPLPGNMLMSETDKQVLTLELCGPDSVGGLHVRHTNTRDDTLHFLVNLYRWWTDKSLSEHTSHLAVHQPRSFLPVTKRQAALMAWPDIGRKTALAAEQHFGSIRRAANAGVTEWAGIETQERGKTRRIGHKVASNIVAFVEGELDGTVRSLDMAQRCAVEVSARPPATTSSVLRVQGGKRRRSGFRSWARRATK